MFGLLSFLNSSHLRLFRVALERAAAQSHQQVKEETPPHCIRYMCSRAATFCPSHPIAAIFIRPPSSPTLFLSSFCLVFSLPLFTPQQSLDVDYVLVIFGGVTGYSSDDINKFLWPVRIGSGVFPDDMHHEKVGALLVAGASVMILPCTPPTIFAAAK